MKLYPNLRPALLVISLLFFYSLQAFAQYPGMGAVRAQQSRQFVNQQMQMQMQMMNNLNWRQNAGKGDTYTVTFKDSTVKKVVSFMYTDTVLHKNFLVYVDKKFPKSDTIHRNQKIYTDQTKYISVIGDYRSGAEMYGVPTDSCWMFKVIDGSLAVYARSLNYLTERGGLLNETNFDPSAIVGIQLNDGPIEKYSKDNLIKMVGQNADALEAIGKGKYYKAVTRYNRDAEKAAKK
ncbi:MAG: hypothetical protein JST50_12115 [Bacteroidetes bacterium]|jgi:hypothetical protein|nr:hypothetical protein [Bacteroidota bacterium]